MDVGPMKIVQHVIKIVGGYTAMLNGVTEKILLDVFVSEVGLRLFIMLYKHIKR